MPVTNQFYPTTAAQGRVMTKNLPKYYNNRSKEHNLSGGAQMLNVVTTTEGSADSQSRHLVSGKFRAAHQSN